MGKSSLLAEALAPAPARAPTSCCRRAATRPRPTSTTGSSSSCAGGFPRNAGVDPIEPDPDHDYRRVGAALLRVVDEATLAGALVVVVDDAQWADVASLEALTFGARRLERGRHGRLRRGHPARRGRPAAPGPGGAGRGGRQPARPAAARPAGHRPAGRGPLRPPAAGARRRPAVAAHDRQPAARDDAHRRPVVRGMVRPGDLPAPRSYAGLVLSRLVAASRRRPVAGHGARRAGRPGAARRGGRHRRRRRPRHRRRPSWPTGAWPTSSPGPEGPVLVFPHGLVHASVATDLSPSRRAALHAAAARVTSGDEALRHRLAAAHGPDAALVAEARAAADRRAATRLPGGGGPPPARRRGAWRPRWRSTSGSMADAAVHLVVAGRPLGALEGEVRASPPARPQLRARAPGPGPRLARRGRAATSPTPGHARPRREAITATGADPTARRSPGRRPTCWRSWRCTASARPTPPPGPRGRWRPGATRPARRRRWSTAWPTPATFAGADAQMTELLATETRPAILLDARLGRGVVRMWANDLGGARDDLIAGARPRRRAGRRSWPRPTCGRSWPSWRSAPGRWAEALDRLAGRRLGRRRRGRGVARRPAPRRGRHRAGLQRAGWPRPARHAGCRLRGRRGHRHAGQPAVGRSRLLLRLAVAEADHPAVVAVGDRTLAEGWDTIPEGIHAWRASYAESLLAVGRHGDAAADGGGAGRRGRPRAGEPSLARRACPGRGRPGGGRGATAEAADAAFAAGLALDAEASRPFERARLELAAAAHQRRTGRRRAAADLLAQAGRHVRGAGGGAVGRARAPARSSAAACAPATGRPPATPTSPPRSAWSPAWSPPG